MSNRQAFELTDEEMDQILDASKPVPYLIFNGQPPASPQENANRAWEQLGRKHGFKFMTVQPISGKSTQHFTAEVDEKID